MSDLIHLLPDSVANQIAAGEVIQRPASVVKELVENAVDAGADSISVEVKDAGKTLIRISDNGSGMSETDARMAFERHATSKIKKAEDLFALNTMGFRGEALASVAAVADVELKTRPDNYETGTHIHIKGSELIKQEPVQTSKGSIFSIKNLFFNIPARRKFLKKDITEYKHIKHEFLKIALANPNIEFRLTHNKEEDYILPVSGLRMRVMNATGKSKNKLFLTVNSKTSIVKIYGLVGKPEAAKKRNKEQYFFVNRRYMRHPYFYKAVLSAYENLIPSDYSPSFYLYFDISPNRIDINIHPQKTEINFDDSQGIFSILRASVRQALGKNNASPSIDFDQSGAEHNLGNSKSDFGSSFSSKQEQANFMKPKTGNGNKEQNRNYIDNLNNWEELYKSFENEGSGENDKQDQNSEKALFETENYSSAFQFGQKYIATSVKSGLVLVHYKRAKQRIVYEQLKSRYALRNLSTQKLLYQQKVVLTDDDYDLLKAAEDELKRTGLHTEKGEEKGSIFITSMPSEIGNIEPKKVLEELLLFLRDEPDAARERVQELICKAAVRNLANSPAKKLSNQEIQELLSSLFSCPQPSFNPDGNPIMLRIDFDEIHRRFK